MKNVMPRKTKFELPPLDLGKETLGQRLARLRKERGLTQVELAEKIGVNQAIITDYERGKMRMFDEMIVRFSLALNVSTDEILGKVKDRKNSYKPSLKITKRLAKIDELPISQQRALLKTIDNFLKGAAVSRSV